MLFFECSLEDHEFLVSRPHLPEEGPIDADPAPASSETPEAGKNQDRDEAEESLEESDSTTSPPPAALPTPKIKVWRKRGSAQKT
jgi:hypothetical protein